MFNQSSFKLNDKCNLACYKFSNRIHVRNSRFTAGDTDVSVHITRSVTINPYSAGIDFSRQNLTSTSKVDPRTVRLIIFLMVVDP